MNQSGRPPYPAGMLLNALLGGSPLPDDGGADAGRVIDGDFRRADAGPTPPPLAGPGVAGAPPAEPAAPQSPASPPAVADTTVHPDPLMGSADGPTGAGAPPSAAEGAAADAPVPPATPGTPDLIGEASAAVMLGEHLVPVVFGKDGTPWFVAAEVSAALGFRFRPDRGAARRIDAGDKGTGLVRLGHAGRRAVIVVNVSGLLQLLRDSPRPLSESFERWVAEVLPTLSDPAREAARREPSDEARGPEEGLRVLKAATLRREDLHANAAGDTPAAAAGRLTPEGWMRELIFGTQPVRISLDENGNPWFNVNDVCSVLELTNPRKAIADHVDADDLTKREVVDARGRRQRANHINEAGLYPLVFGSTKAVAKRFKRWVTGEVLPALRQTGRYEMGGATGQGPTPRAAAEPAGVHRGVRLALRRTPPAVPAPLSRPRLVGIEIEPDGGVRVAVHDPANGLDADRVWRGDGGGRAPGRVVQYVLARLARRADDLLVVACDDLPARAPIVARETDGGPLPGGALAVATARGPARGRRGGGHRDRPRRPCGLGLGTPAGGLVGCPRGRVDGVPRLPVGRRDGRRGPRRAVAVRWRAGGGGEAARGRAGAAGRGRRGARRGAGARPGSGAPGVRVDSLPAFPAKSINLVPLNALRSTLSPAPSPEIR